MARSPNTPPGETVRRLAAVEARIRRLQRERERLIREARVERASWQTIAAALGVSRQAAWEAHREGTAVVAQIRARSTLSDEAAMAVVGSTLREVRREPPG